MAVYSISRRRTPAPRSERPSPHAQPPIAVRTGPLGELADHDVLVLADAQNLDASASKCGFDVLWSTLGRRIDQSARSASRCVFFATRPGDGRRSAALRASGWRPYPKAARHVATHRGMERKSNVDTMMACIGGALAAASSATLILIASGDGDLVEDISEATLHLPRFYRIGTLSVAGATAQRLDARTSPFVNLNIELGLDCLRRRASNNKLRIGRQAA